MSTIKNFAIIDDYQTKRYDFKTLKELVDYVNENIDIQNETMLSVLQKDEYIIRPLDEVVECFAEGESPEDLEFF